MNGATLQHAPFDLGGFSCVFSRAARPPLFFPLYWEPAGKRRLRHPQPFGHFRPTHFVFRKQSSCFGQAAWIVKQASPTPPARFSPVFLRGNKTTLRSHTPIAQNKHLHCLAKILQILRCRPQLHPSRPEFLDQPHQVTQRLTETRNRPDQQGVSTSQLLPTALQLRAGALHLHPIDKHLLSPGLLKRLYLRFAVFIDRGDAGIAECPGKTCYSHAEKSTTESAEPAQQQTQDRARSRPALRPEGLRSVSWVLHHVRRGQTRIAATAAAITAYFSTRRRAVAGPAARGAFPGSGITLHNANYRKLT